MEQKITEPLITKLKPKEVFVFGSNLAGIHGAGAARQAYDFFGAEWGVGEGLTGNCYALPTKDKRIVTITLDGIQKHVSNLLEVVKERTDLHFLITEVGCGLAGLTPEQIAPMFEKFVGLDNCSLPERFVKILNR